MSRTLKHWAIGILVAGGIASLFWLDFRVWRAMHPDAPTWTYFASGRRH